MTPNKIKILVSFGAGLATMAGQCLMNESYKLYEAYDPLYSVRVKLGRKKREKIFKDMMIQTNLKGDFA